MDVTSILSMIDPEQIITIIVGIIAVIGYVIAAIKNAQKKNAEGASENATLALEKAKEVIGNISDVFRSDIPQTGAQTAALSEVSDKTWKTPDSVKDQVYVWLRAKAAEITKSDLLGLIALAEYDKQVEYGIIVVDKYGEPCTDCEHAFISYGYPSYGTLDQINAKIEQTSSEAYEISSLWIMQEDVRQQIISEIGTSYPDCIAKAMNTIAEAEEKQIEKYYVNCNNHCWEITRGNITKQFAGEKNTE